MAYYIISLQRNFAESTAASDHPLPRFYALLEGLFEDATQFRSYGPFDDLQEFGKKKKRFMEQDQGGFLVLGCSSWSGTARSCGRFGTVVIIFQATLLVCSRALIKAFATASACRLLDWSPVANRPFTKPSVKDFSDVRRKQVRGLTARRTILKRVGAMKLYIQSDSVLQSAIRRDLGSQISREH